MKIKLRETPLKNKILNLDAEEKKNTKFSKDTFQMLHFAYAPYKWIFFGIVFIGFFGRLLVLGNSTVIGFWVDSLSEQPERKAHLPSMLHDFNNWDYMWLLGGMCLSGFILALIFRVSFSRLSAYAISSIYDEVTLRTSRFNMSFFDRNPAGKIITRFSSDYGNVFRMFGGPLAEFFSLIFDLILIVILLALASPYYLLIVVLIAVCNYFVFRINQMKLRESRRTLSASRSPSIAHFAETTQGANNIRAYNKAENFIQRFSELDQHFLDKKLSTTGQVLNFSLQMNFLSAFIMFLTGLLSWYLARQNLVSVGSIGVAFGMIALSSGTVNMFFEWFSQLEEALVGAERLNQFLQYETEPGNRLPSSAVFATSHWKYDHSAELQSPWLHRTQASLEVKNLWLRYDENGPWVLKGLNFEIQPGERVGIIGRTGSGKTSLIQAIFYLYPFSEGSIAIDGLTPSLSVEQKGIDLNLYRRSISLISQEPTLLQGSLRDNLDPLHLHSDPELEESLKKVDLVYMKLDDLIEEKGKNLSAGEKQLVCMARCLLQSSPIVIMDEATSNVDPQSEEIMVRATEEIFADRTQLIIAHRLTTLEKCHRIIWLDQGELKMVGPSAEVLSHFNSSTEKSH